MNFNGWLNLTDAPELITTLQFSIKICWSWLFKSKFFFVKSPMIGINFDSKLGINKRTWSNN
jgi:hypothetical protein